MTVGSSSRTVICVRVSCTKTIVSLTGMSYFPAKDLIFFQADIHSNLLEQQRIAVLKARAERENVTVITTMAACMNHLMPSEIWQKQVLTFAPGDVLDMEAMKSTLVQLGYERTAQAEGPGQLQSVAVFWMYIR